MHENGTWNRSLVHDIYSNSDAATFIAMPISKFGAVGKPLWLGTASGDFSVKSAYNLLISGKKENQNPTPHNQTNWYNLWRLHLPPKLKMFCWKLMHKGLPIGELLRHRNIGPTAYCTFGCQSVETYDHLFLHCHIARSVWFGSIMNLRTENVSTIGIVSWIAGLVSNCNASNRGTTGWDATHLAIWICWGIYHQRNETLFRNSAANLTSIIHLIGNMMNQHARCHNNQLGPEQKIQRSLSPTSLDNLNWVVDFCNWKTHKKIGVGIFQICNNLQSFCATILSQKPDNHPRTRVIHEDISNISNCFHYVSFSFSDFRLKNKICKALLHRAVGSFFFVP